MFSSERFSSYGNRGRNLIALGISALIAPAVLAGCSQPDEDSLCFVGPLFNFGQATSVNNAGRNLLRYGLDVTNEAMDSYSGLGAAATEVTKRLYSQSKVQKTSNALYHSDIIKLCVHLYNSDDPNAGGRFMTAAKDRVDLTPVQAVDDISKTPERYSSLPENTVYKEAFSGGVWGTIEIPAPAPK